MLGNGGFDGREVVYLGWHVDDGLSRQSGSAKDVLKMIVVEGGWVGPTTLRQTGQTGSIIFVAQKWECK